MGGPDDSVWKSLMILGQAAARGKPWRLRFLAEIVVCEKNFVN